MACPDTDRLIDSLPQGTFDLELAAHVRYCRTCQAELGLLRAVKAELESEPEVPKELIERTLAAIPFPEAHDAATQRVSPGHVLVAGFLGASTAAVTVAASELTGSGSPFHLLVFLSLAGVGAALAEARAETGPRKAQTPR